MAQDNSDTVFKIDNLTMAYGNYVVMQDLNFEIKKGEVFFIMGGSGCGKSTLLRHMIGLIEPAKGDIYYKGQNFSKAELKERQKILQQFGVLYQSGALWSSMTLAENIALPLQEFKNIPKSQLDSLIELKLALVGLAGFGGFYPSEISGGMCKRAGLARAIALDPQVLFFDEPSAGLDPISSYRLDQLILEMRDSLGATVIVVSHELSSILDIADKAIFLDAAKKRQAEIGNPKDMLNSENEAVRLFLNRGIDPFKK